MAGYVYGVRAEGVVVLILSEIGNDEVEMDGRHCLRETRIGVGDGGRGRVGRGYVGKGKLTQYLVISS